MNTRRGFLASLAALVAAPLAMAAGKRLATGKLVPCDALEAQPVLVDAAEPLTTGFCQTVGADVGMGGPFVYYTYDAETGESAGPFDRPPSRDIAAPAPTKHKKPRRNVRAPHGGQTRGGHRRSGGKR